MSYNQADFPTSVWDGTSPTRSNREVDSGPGVEDWDQIVSELIAVQTQFNQTAITDLTDSSGGTVDGTVEAVPSDTLGTLATAANNNFAELSTKLDAVIVALRNANIIVT